MCVPKRPIYIKLISDTNLKRWWRLLLNSVVTFFFVDLFESIKINIETVPERHGTTYSGNWIEKDYGIVVSSPVIR